jgi:hypothetical protein
MQCFRRVTPDADRVPAGTTPGQPFCHVRRLCASRHGADAHKRHGLRPGSERKLQRVRCLQVRAQRGPQRKSARASNERPMAHPRPAVGHELLNHCRCDSGARFSGGASATSSKASAIVTRTLLRVRAVATNCPVPALTNARRGPAYGFC